MCRTEHCMLFADSANFVLSHLLFLLLDCLESSSCAKGILKMDSCESCDTAPPADQLLLHWSWQSGWTQLAQHLLDNNFLPTYTPPRTKAGSLHSDIYHPSTVSLAWYLGLTQIFGVAGWKTGWGLGIGKSILLVQAMYNFFNWLTKCTCPHCALFILHVSIFTTEKAHRSSHLKASAMAESVYSMLIVSNHDCSNICTHKLC